MRRKKKGEEREKQNQERGGAATRTTCDSPNLKYVLLSLHKSPPTSHLEALTQPRAFTTPTADASHVGTSGSGLSHVHHTHIEPTSYSTHRLGSSSSLQLLVSKFRYVISPL